MKKSYILYGLLLFLILQNEAVAQIKHIRWGTNKNPLEGLTITWQNSGTADLIKWGYTSAFEQGTFPGISRPGYTDTFFDYKFPVVNADVTIHYELFNSQNSTWTEEKTFLTAPPINTANFSFIATGDSRSGADVWGVISALAHSKQADFTVFNGDIVRDPDVPAQWDDWFDFGQNFLEKNLVLHALGNHDALSIPDYLNNFELPASTPTGGTELYYAVNYGEAVFISLDSEIADDVNQYNWLINTLQVNVNKKWKIIFFHKPFYTMGPHTGEMDSYLNTWWKAFDDYGVDLILTGHDHMYERTKPLNRNISLTEPVTTYGSRPDQGRCQVVCGGAGAGLTDLTSNWYIESYKKSHNFCKIEVTTNTMCGTVYDEMDLVIDSFCIDKTPLGVNAPTTLFYPLKIVPNPVTDSFKIIYNAPNIGEVKITIFDLNGKLIDSKKAQKNEAEFTFKYDASKLPSAIYSVEVQIGNQKDHALMVRK